MAKVRLYHGTAHEFGSFDGHYARRGSEPNSALGIHLTEHAATAALYAEMSLRDRGAGEARVLVLDVEIGRALLTDSVEDFMGRPLDIPLDSDVMRGWSDFVEARLALEDRGFHAVALDTPIEDLAGAWAVFDPARIRVVGGMDLDQAFEHEGDEADLAGIEMVSGALFDDAQAPCRP